MQVNLLSGGNRYGNPSPADFLQSAPKALFPVTDFSAHFPKLAVMHSDQSFI